MSLTLILTIQKIIPLYILSIFSLNKLFLFISIIICAILPPLMILNLINLKKIFRYSSINQIGWLILLSMSNNIIWLIYITSYTLFLTSIIYIIKFYKIFTNFFLSPKHHKALLIICILNLARSPPFSLFTLKWFSIYLVSLISININFILILLITRSFIIFYIYIKILYLSIFISLSLSKIKSIYSNYLTFTKIILFLSTLLLSFIIIIF